MRLRAQYRSAHCHSIVRSYFRLHSHCPPNSMNHQFKWHVVTQRAKIKDGQNWDETMSDEAMSKVLAWTTNAQPCLGAGRTRRRHWLIASQIFCKCSADSAYPYLLIGTGRPPVPICFGAMLIAITICSTISRGRSAIEMTMGFS